jgi:hypothetical protein
MLTAKFVAEVRTLAETEPERDASDLSALQSIPEVFGYVIAMTRNEGGSEEDEADAVELWPGSVMLVPAKCARSSTSCGGSAIVRRRPGSDRSPGVESTHFGRCRSDRSQCGTGPGKCWVPDNKTGDAMAIRR